MTWFTLFLMMTLCQYFVTGGKIFSVKGCQSHSNIIQNGTIVAGYGFTGEGNEVPELACMGDMITMYADYLATTESNKTCYRLGSMIVNPGCKAFLFKTADYQGEYHTLNEGIYPDVNKSMTFGQISNGIPCITAYMGICKQTYPTCDPEDKWETITEWDNTMGFVSTTFSYPQTIGTTFSLEVTMSFGENIAIRKIIISKFFTMFAEKLGKSVTTNYNWNETGIATMSEPTTIEVTQVVPAGGKISIQQVVGNCGGSIVKTSLFRTING